MDKGKEGNVLLKNVLDIFYLQFYGIGFAV